MPNSEDVMIAKSDVDKTFLSRRLISITVSNDIQEQ